MMDIYIYNGGKILLNYKNKVIASYNSNAGIFCQQKRETAMVEIDKLGLLSGWSGYRRSLWVKN